MITAKFSRPRPALPLLFVLAAVALILIACASTQSTDQMALTAQALPQPPTAEAVAKLADTVTATNTAEANSNGASSSAAPIQEENSAGSAGETASDPQPPAAATIQAAAYPPPTDRAVYLPFTGGSQPGSAQAAPEQEPEAQPKPAPTADFAAARQELQAQGQDLSFVKLGFHLTLPENREVLDDWLMRLDEAGVPVFLKSVDNAEPLFKAQELMRSSGVPHVLVYRSSGSVPHYELPAAQAAQIHWTMHRDLFPPELDPTLVWIETLNEPDRTNSEWLAQFALETARLAMADGFRWAAFGWASGEPEPEHWQGPAMQEFLRLAGENPDQLAIALHEYSYTQDHITHEYPFKIGRFQALFEIVDQLGIPRPTVLITEWGWEHNDIPPVEEAIKDIRWAAKLYSAYPQVRGAAIWNIGIGCCFGDISEQVQELIDPLTELSLREYYPAPINQQPVNPDRFGP